MEQTAKLFRGFLLISVTVTVAGNIASVTDVRAQEVNENCDLFVSWKWIPSSNESEVTFNVMLNQATELTTKDYNITFSNYGSPPFNVCVIAEAGSSTSEPACQDKLFVPKDKNLGLALGLGLGLPIALILLVALAYLCRRYLKKSSKPGSSKSQYGSSAFDNIGMSYEPGHSSTHNGNHTPDTLSDQKRTGVESDPKYIDDEQVNLLRDEFARMFKNPKPSGHSTSISNKHKELNRYTNIEPYDHTLVKVSYVEYINASYVMNRKFIATQDPYPNQDDDLWQMIWNSNVRIIIRLSNDSASNPTAHYIRDEIGGNWVMGHDELVVSVKDIQKNSCFEKRTVTVTKDSHSRIIEHFHMTNWSEGSVPSADDLYQLVTSARNSHKKYNDGSEGPQPVLVHCSAGIGRTGTVIALWCMMDEYEEKFFSNIVKTLEKIREDRMGMVQTEDQYVRIYECFMLFQDKSTIIRGDEYEHV